MGYYEFPSRLTHHRAREGVATFLGFFDQSPQVMTRSIERTGVFIRSS